jgi:2-polyprenyl-3-methyl-5-hydroxy-6-metoxy-1,4-benzoquinol methylase
MKVGAHGGSFRSGNPGIPEPGSGNSRRNPEPRQQNGWAKRRLEWRHRQPERMDAPGLDPALHRQALDGLARINRVSGTARRLWSTIERECVPAGSSLRVLEIGSGGGDVLRSMAQRHPEHVFHGVDIQPVAVEYARERSASVDNVRFAVADVLSSARGSGESFSEACRIADFGPGEPTGSDVVMSSLFLHHLDEIDAVNMLKACRFYSKNLVLVDDLCRTRAGYALAWLGARILSRSPVVHTDGPLSVAGAFTPAEARLLACAAGLRRVEVQTHWPERFLLSANSW